MKKIITMMMIALATSVNALNIGQTKDEIVKEGWVINTATVSLVKYNTYQYAYCVIKKGKHEVLANFYDGVALEFAYFHYSADPTEPLTTKDVAKIFAQKLYTDKDNYFCSEELGLVSHRTKIESINATEAIVAKQKANAMKDEF